MSASRATDPAPTHGPRAGDGTRRIAAIRAAPALVWAVAVMAAVGHSAKTTDAAVPFAAAALLASYPLIDVIASVLTATRVRTTPARGLRVNAAIGALAVLAIGAAGFGSDAGATLAVFGVWAAVSGALQFTMALQRRRTDGGQGALLFSGGLSTLAGLSFLASSQGDKANLGSLGGYMAAGAVLFLISAYRSRRAGQQLA